MSDYTSQFAGAEIDARLAKVPQLESGLAGKQATLVGTGTGQNIKTVGGTNILGSGDIPVGDENAVKFTAQNLNDTQKTQARNNIGAASISDIQSSDYVVVTQLPSVTPTASNLGHIYLVGPDQSGNYERYVAQYDGSSYAWIDIGSTSLALADYATKAEFNLLAIKLNQFGGFLVPLLKKIAYEDDDAKSLIDSIDALLNTNELLSITAVYTQPRAIYTGESLDDLKVGLVVTANYASGASVEVNDYALSGTLAAGTTTITVTYQNKTTTFNVTVTDAVYYKDGALFGVRVGNRNSITTDAGLGYSYIRNGVAYVFTNDYTKSSSTVTKQRCSYFLFDLLLTSGKTYKFTVEFKSSLGTNQTILAGLGYFDSTYKAAGDANLYQTQDYTSNIYDSGWQSTTKDGNKVSLNYTTPTGYVGVRFTMKLQNSGNDIDWPTSFLVDRFIIQEVTE